MVTCPLVPMMAKNRTTGKKDRDLCKTPPFAQFLRQSQILILKILNVFLRLKFSPSLALNKIGHFSKVSDPWGIAMGFLVHL
jgi:hypothetical protein